MAAANSAVNGSLAMTVDQVVSSRKPLSSACTDVVGPVRLNRASGRSAVFCREKGHGTSRERFAVEGCDARNA